MWFYHDHLFYPPFHLAPPDRCGFITSHERRRRRTVARGAVASSHRRPCLGFTPLCCACVVPLPPVSTARETDLSHMALLRAPGPGGARPPGAAKIGWGVCARRALFQRLSQVMGPARDRNGNGRQKIPKNFRNATKASVTTVLAPGRARGACVRSSHARGSGATGWLAFFAWWWAAVSGSFFLIAAGRASRWIRRRWQAIGTKAGASFDFRECDHQVSRCVPRVALCSRPWWCWHLASIGSRTRTGGSSSGGGGASHCPLVPHSNADATSPLNRSGGSRAFDWRKAREENDASMHDSVFFSRYSSSIPRGSLSVAASASFR